MELHPNPILQLIHVAERIEPQNRDRTRVRPPHSFHAFHRGGLAGAVRTNQPENFTFVHLKRNVGDGHGCAVSFADAGDLDDFTAAGWDVDKNSRGLKHPSRTKASSEHYGPGFRCW